MAYTTTFTSHHGEAVAWGIGRAITLSCNKGYCLESEKNKILKVLELYNYDTKAIPAAIQGGGIGERFISVMHKDKKNLTSKIRLIIPKAVGDIVIEEAEESEILAIIK